MGKRTSEGLGLIVVLVWGATLLSGCTSRSVGQRPSIWIDQPLSGAVPLSEVLDFQAHASDADGVARFEFYVNDEKIADVPARGQRLDDARLQWQPPGIGTYNLRVMAYDTGGNRGESSLVSIQVRGELDLQLNPTITSTPPLSLTPTRETPAVDAQPLTLTPTLPPTFTVLPSITPPQLPATVTPTVTATALPLDTTPPAITDLSANPALISVAVPCGATPATTLIQVHISDARGVAWAIVRIAGVGEFNLFPGDGENYTATLGPFSEAGTLTILVQAQDRAGNVSISAPIEVYVVSCPG